VATAELPRTAGHVFYERVNRILNETNFDRFVEDACEKFYAAVTGRPSLGPGRYFRMLLVGYFEGIEQRVGTSPRPGHANHEDARTAGLIWRTRSNMPPT